MIIRVERTLAKISKAESEGRTHDSYRLAKKFLDRKGKITPRSERVIGNVIKRRRDLADAQDVVERVSTIYDIIK